MERKGTCFQIDARKLWKFEGWHVLNYFFVNSLHCLIFKFYPKFKTNNARPCKFNIMKSVGFELVSISETKQTNYFYIIEFLKFYF